MIKSVVKAILLLEVTRAELTTDRASSNRTTLSQLGISGKIRQLSNYFWNPFNDKHKVFVFSDAPYLIKTIQNCLYNKHI